MVLAGQEEAFRNDYYSTFIFNADGKAEYVELFNPLEADMNLIYAITATSLAIVDELLLNALLLSDYSLIFVH